MKVVTTPCDDISNQWPAMYEEAFGSYQGQELPRGLKLVCVTEDCGKKVGWVITDLAESSFVHFGAMAAEYRNSHKAASAFEIILGEMKNHGVKSVTLNVLRENRPMLRLALATDFEIRGMMQRANKNIEIVLMRQLA